MKFGTSQGMILCAVSEDGQQVLLTTPESKENSIPTGFKVT